MRSLVLSVVLLTAVSSCACAVVYLPECGPPKTQKDGNLKFYPLRHHYPLGSEVNFYCKHGYMLSGESYTVCTIAKEARRAVWNNEIPVCERITCPTLENPDNGTVDDGNNLPGINAVYSCDEGFVLVGEATRLCQYNGSWDGQPPVCDSIICPKLEDPEHGTVDEEDNLPGSEAFYSCAKGFVLVGEVSRLCQNNGTWDGQLPVCKQCQPIPIPKDVFVFHKIISGGADARYSCL